MKHLKRFLESIDCDEVDDIFLEVSDYGFNVRVFDEEREIADENIDHDLSWDEFNDSIRIFEMLTIIITKKGSVLPRRVTFLINEDNEESNELKDCILRVIEIYKDYELTMNIVETGDSNVDIKTEAEVILLNNNFVYGYNKHKIIDSPIVELTITLEKIT
jgi:hypothetical protein